MICLAWEKYKLAQVLNSNLILNDFVKENLNGKNSI